ncbi:hypothetical protein BKA56DRAFT_241223 [Ilyonectria sp. MPI-CAGE-AT-0026]|nr:hypothetical protein BKA56DRAFT_241223 [Ilyonectria sp. MPI-CAGE-AT-0026]
MIRQEVADFTEMWNGHRIRPQKNREHLVAGIPMDLYNTSEVVLLDCAGMLSALDEKVVLIVIVLLAIEGPLRPYIFEWSLLGLES